MAAEPLTTSDSWEDKKRLKAVIFDRMQVQAKPGLDITYLEGVNQHEKQLEYHFPDREPKRSLIAGGQRSGKSIALAADYVPDLASAGTQIWHCANPLDNTKRVFDYVYRWIVIEKILGDAVKIEHRNSRDEGLIKIHWAHPRDPKKTQPAWIKCKSTDPNQGYRALVGEQLDRVGWDECADQPGEIFTQYLQPRLMNRRGRADFVSEPKDLNWFYEYYMRGKDKDFQEDGWHSLSMGMADNPFIDPDEIEKMRRSMSDSEFKRVCLGQFVSLVGELWPMFKQAYIEDGGHIFRPGEFDFSDSTNYRGIDIGISHPTGCAWAHATREKNDLFLFRDYEEIEPTHEHHAANIKASTQESIQSTFISHDARRRSGTDAKLRQASPWHTYRKQGIISRLVEKDLGNVFVNRVGAYLQAGLEEHSEHPSLYISEDCPKSIAAIQRAQWKKNKFEGHEQGHERPKKYKDDLDNAIKHLCATKPGWVPHHDRQGENLGALVAMSRKRGGSRHAPKRSRLPGYARVPH